MSKKRRTEPGPPWAASSGSSLVRAEPVGRERLDVLLVARGLVASREQARARILAGDVLVDGQAATKPAVLLSDGAVLEVRAAPAFVSRGGEKLMHALAVFDVVVADQ